MSLYIAGGYGEHGRNCFLIEADKYNIMVDCGIMNGCGDPYPKLSPKQIEKTKYLFITHSHIDHIGALPYLYSRGFNGTVYLSQHTYHQMKTKPKKFKFIEAVCPSIETEASIDEIASFSYGKSGHCIGSVWYLITCGKKKYLFTGDYCEHSLVYQCDRIRGLKADFAVIDCAYGRNNIGSKQCIQHFQAEITNLCSRYSKILLPVPEYGRGADIYFMMNRQRSNILLFAEEKILSTFFHIGSKEWIVPDVSNTISKFSNTNGYSSELIFICDAQLKSEESRILANTVISDGGIVLFSGSLDKNGFADSLYQSDKASFLRYPVHQNYEEAEKLSEQNNFKEVYYVHSTEKLGGNS